MIFICNKSNANWGHTETEEVQMIELLAAGAFVGLFGMWVVLPRFIIRK